MRKAMLILAIVALLVPLASGCGGGQAKRPNVIRVSTGGTGDVPTLDPGLSEDTTSITIVEDCYVGLTRYDEVTNKLYPGMATKWDVSADGLTYTFHLRNDVPWVKYDTAKKQVVKVQDCDGKDRMVNAFDFEYGIIRALKPETASPYAYLPDMFIVGAQDFTDGKNTDPTSVGVKAIDATTLEIKFLTAAAYNPGVVGLWTCMPVPKWVIEGDACNQAAAEKWIEPGTYQSYGPFTVSEWIHDSTLTMVKNPFWPGDEQAPKAKVDSVVFHMIDDTTAMPMYEAGDLEMTTVPLADMDRVKADPTLSKELIIAPSLCTYFYGFNTTAPFVDDVRVRRALSMAVDRQALVNTVTKGGQIPAQWLARPGLGAAPTLEDHPDLGVKTNIAEAKKLLDEYLKEKNLTIDKLDISLMFNTSSGHQAIAEFMQQQWKANLGIDVKVTNQEWAVFLETTKGKDTPQVFRMGWCLDYPDANNFTREVVASGGSNNPTDGAGNPEGGLMWKNDKFEQLVKDAAVEPDPAKRLDLYAQAEQILCWDDAAIIPLYWYTTVSVTKPYVKRTVSSGGHQRYEKWEVSQN